MAKSENSLLNLKARGRAPEFETIFIDSTALPDKILKQIIQNKSTLSRDSFLSTPKIRLDFVPKLKPTSKEISVLSVIEKIINRGKLTRLSKESEEWVFKNFENKDLSNDDIIFSLKNILNKSPQTQLFDGSPRKELGDVSAEEFFFEKILSPNIGNENLGAVIPQAAISSFVANPENFQEQRVDFLIKTPDLKIIIEIDDSTHKEKSHSDNLRDQAFKEVGFEVARIPAEELSNENSQIIEEITYKLKSYRDKNNSRGAFNKIIAAGQIIHTLQLTLIALRKGGAISNNSKIFIDTNSFPFFEKSEIKEIADRALEELRDLSSSICKIYDLPEFFSEISWTKNIKNANKTISTSKLRDVSISNSILIQDLIIDENLTQFEYLKLENIRPKPILESLRFILNFIYRFNDFRPNQFEGVSNTLTKKDSIVLLPTGSGKSIIYQLCSFILPGISIVVAPIISLIEDQIQNLESIGVDRCLGVSSKTKNQEEILKNISNGQYLQLYISPERMQKEDFRNAITGFCLSKPIPLFSIDEAHCVSEWGHDFRVAYLNIAELGRKFYSSQGIPPTILALTATASDFVLKDMQRELLILEDNTISPPSFDRKELILDVVKCSPSEKPKTLHKILTDQIPKEFNTDFESFRKLQGDQTNCGIIFCPFANGDYGTSGILANLAKWGFENSELYAGEKPKSISTKYEKTWGEEKTKIATMFKNNEFQILSATKAFGMGVDKPNIRFTVHYNLPPSIESYIQEAGRGGRDSKKTINFILASLDDYGVGIKNRNDIERNQFFFENAFRGVDKEMEDLEKVLAKLKLKNNSVETYNFSYRDRASEEKSIYRLKSIGVVEDYTINYANRTAELTIGKISKTAITKSYRNYLSKYNEEMAAAHELEIISINEIDKRKFILATARKLLEEYIYALIAESRKMAQENIHKIISNALKIEDQNKRRSYIKEETLRHFSNSFTEILDELKTSSSNVENLISKVKSRTSTKLNYKNLLAQINRALESDPNNPSLLLSSAFLSAYSEEGFSDNIAEKIISAIAFIERYSPQNTDAAYKQTFEILKHAFEKDKELSLSILDNIWNDINKEVFFRFIPDDDSEYSKTLKLLSINQAIIELTKG